MESSAPFAKPALQFFLDSLQTGTPNDSILLIYIFLIALCTSLTILVFLMSTMNRVYHRNLKRLYQVGVLIWFVLIISKMLVMATQRFYLGNLYSLAVAAFFRYFYVYFFTASPLSIILERHLATFYLMDYEKRHRPWIFYTIFLSNLSIATIFSCLIILQLISIRVFALHILSVLLLTVLLYWGLYWTNSKRLEFLEHRRIDTSRGDLFTYTLSTKYQLKETLVTLRSMRSLLLVILIAIFLILLTSLLPILLKLPLDPSASIHIFTDIVYHFSPLYTSPACLYFIPQNRELIGARLGLQKSSSPEHVIHNQVNAADVYFNMFHKSLGTGFSNSKCKNLLIN